MTLCPLLLAATLAAGSQSLWAAPGQPAPPPAPSAIPAPSTDLPAGLADIPIDNLSQRLEALRPTDPVAYFRLAEEVAEERDAPAARPLARRLYVLAFELDRAANPPTGLAASACLGLAALTTVQSEQRWLRALAIQFEPPALGDQSPQAALRIDPPAVPERAALAVASALGALRAAEGSRAAAILRRPGHWAVLEQHESMLQGGAARIRDLLTAWPSCPECHNRRIVNRPVAPNTPATPRFCSTCNGIPGPALSQPELLGQLRLEAALLRGIHRLWSAQIQADSGDPLRDPRPDDLALRFRVDTRAVLFRAGKWVPDPARPDPVKQPAQAPAPTSTPPANTPPAGG